jgi:hypothetical protein
MKRTIFHLATLLALVAFASSALHLSMIAQMQM